MIGPGIGKGEAVSSILTGGTTNLIQNKAFLAVALLREIPQHCANVRPKRGQNGGNLFAGCSQSESSVVQGVEVREWFILVQNGSIKTMDFLVRS